MALSDLYGVLRRRWLTMVALTLAALAVAAAYASTVPTTYTASTRLYVAMATGTSVNDSYQGGLAAQQRIASYSYVAEGPTVARRVIDDLGLRTSPQELQQRVTVTFPPATTLLEISVTDSSADGARALADGVAAQVRAVVDEMETTVAGAAPAARLNVLDPATTPTAPTSPDVQRIMAVGLFGGLALGGLFALVRDRLDRRARRPEQVSGVLTAPVLAAIPAQDPAAGAMTVRLGARLLAEAASDADPTTLLLTSVSRTSRPDVALGLAAALARAGRRVALIDADISGHGVSARLGKADVPGLADWLREPNRSPEDLVQLVEDEVGLLPVGALDERTSGLLCSSRYAELLTQLKGRFDHLLIDAAPVPVDPAVLAMSAHSSGTLAVVELDTSTLPQVRAAADAFGNRLIGAVTVAAPARRGPAQPNPTVDPTAEPAATPEQADKQADKAEQPEQSEPLKRSEQSEQPEWSEQPELSVGMPATVGGPSKRPSPTARR
jgi:receptor protein-tyrosine kinase